MKIAVACDGLRTSSHAARCGSFMCYTVEKGVITDCRNLPNMGVTSQEAADLINGLGFDVIITKGIDMDMAEDLCASGVEVVAGVDGTSREVVESYVTETLLGAVSLCHVHGDDDNDEEDVDAAFDRIAEKLVASA